MLIANAGPVEIDLTGRTLTVTDGEATVIEVQLDPNQTGLVIDQLASLLEIVVPGSLLGSWLQAAFNSGLEVGRNETDEEPSVEAS